MLSCQLNPPWGPSLGSLLVIPLEVLCSLSSQKPAQCQGHESGAVHPPVQQSTGKATGYLPYIRGTSFSHQLQQDPEQTGDIKQGGGSFAPTSTPTSTQLSTAPRRGPLSHVSALSSPGHLQLPKSLRSSYITKFFVHGFWGINRI